MTNQYLQILLQPNPSFGWIAKKNYTWQEQGKITAGMIGRPAETAPTRWKHTKEIAYKLSKEKATGKYPKTGVGTQTLAPTSTKTAAFMGSIFAHKLRILLKDERLRKIANEFYRDGDSKKGVFTWSTKSSKIKKAGDNVAKRITKELADLGYKILPKDQTERGSQERAIYSNLKTIAEAFKEDEINLSKKMADQVNTNPLELLNPVEAARMINKYGVKKIYTEEFPEALVERLDTAGIDTPYCLREPKKCAYMAIGAVALIGITAGTVSYIFK